MPAVTRHKMHSASTRGFIADVQAYCDTVEIFFPYRPKGLLGSFQNCTTRAWFETCFDSSGAIFGYRLVLQKPTLRVLQHLEPWRIKHKGKICRVDIAFDFTCLPGVDRQALIQFIKCQTMLRWTPGSWMRAVETTRYWVEQVSRNRRSNRDLCFYSNRPSKLDQSPNCIHLELRLFRTETLRRNGVNSLLDLINIDPARLFAKHIRCVDYDFFAFESAFVKAAVRDDILRHRNSRRSPSSAFVEKYRTNVQRRARGYLQRYELARLIRERAPERLASVV
ncbi:hypothetical protein ACVI1J_003907 [Bradyrhizobium diazoefficiens]